MKRGLTWFLILFLVIAPLCALAESTLFTLVLNQPYDAVVLMDQNGNTLSSVVTTTPVNGQTYWTLRVTDNGTDTAFLYTRDAQGNWINENVSYPMHLIFSGQGTTPAPEATAAPTIAPTPSKPWPVYTQVSRTPVTIRLLEGEKRAQSRTGPAKTYHGAGGYKPYKVTSASALFIEGSYMLVDLDYTTVGKRVVYFLTSAFKGTGSVPTVTLTAYPAYTLSALTPTFGPGVAYDAFSEAAIGSGTPLSVFFEENGWVFAEFDSALGYVRAFIPVDMVGW